MKNSAQATPISLPARLWSFLTSPHPSIQDVGERRRAQLLSSLTLIITLSLTLGALTASSPNTFIGFLGITLLAYTLSRTRFYSVGAYFFTFAFTAVPYITIYLGTAGSIDSAITSTVPIALILASALLSQRGFFLLSIAMLAATITSVSYADPKYLIDSTFVPVRTSGIMFSTALLMYGITIFRSRTERERVKQISDVNRELENLTNDLENRVNQRTNELNEASKTTTRRAAQLQTIADLTQAIARVQDPNEIFSAAATLISDRFGFYHVGIFLLDHDREYAILQAANSAGGQKMLARGHRLALGTGVVGFAARTRKPRIALDVGADAVFFNNPDLPETRSEIALPLIYNEQVIGVLDVQSKEAGAFSEDDFRVLGTLASQLAIAIENVRLLSEARASTKQMEEVYNEFIRTQWSRTSERMDFAGFRYNAGRIELVEPLAADATANQAAPSDSNRREITVPVKLRGETIGVLHVESNDLSKEWRSDEISLMEAVAERAALALENARLFQDARRRAAKERMIAEAASNIGSSMNVENILQATAAELERALGGSEVLIRFNNKDSA